MLKTRIITALVALAIVLVALFALPDWAWGIFTLVVVLAALWEWSRFCSMAPASNAVYLICTLLFSGLILFSYVQGGTIGISFSSLQLGAFALAAIFWLCLVPLWLVRSWRPTSSVLRAMAGWLVIFPTWLAFLLLHDISPWLLLSFAAIVWVADISAYFVGRRFGRNKLAPAISPGKTVEGAVGGVGGVILFFFAWRFVIANSPVQRNAWVLDLQSNTSILFALFVVLAVMAVLGDLFESWMKRGAGLKDSSNLLPGHGGILDRIDALTSTLPLAGLYVLLMPRA
ncbi:MAG: phosphatidate cytidylyltransferase [Betaproteobacteria bacterium]